jgi:hypothetical protein
MADDESGAVESGGRGARVLRTGIALLHEGELVLPAAGSEAQAEMVTDDARAVIHYHFPVEIEVRGGSEPAGLKPHNEDRMYRLSRGLRSL